MTYYEKWRDLSAENERLKEELTAICSGYEELSKRILNATKALSEPVKRFQEEDDYGPLHVYEAAVEALDILNPAPPQTAIWVRASQSQSKEAQLQQSLLHELAASHKLPIHTVYYLGGVNGQLVDPAYQNTFEAVCQQLQSVLGLTVEVVYQSLAQHPELLRMLADVKSSRTKCVIAASPSRLARDAKMLRFITQTLAAYDCRLITLDGYDTGTPEGKRKLFDLVSQEEQV